MKKKSTKLILLFLVIFVILALGKNANGQTVVRYATKTVELKSSPIKKSETIETIPQNTKLLLLGPTENGFSKISVKNSQGYVQTKYLHKKKAVNKFPGKKFKRRGRAKWNKCKWTWYSQRELGGKGLRIPGRHLDKKRGFVLDKDGYICLASGRKNKKKKVVVPTPFGRYGKVYDTNGGNNNKWFDVYTNW